jgi:methylated-DNA-protein-cysteine methyltransferase-like protein
MAAKQNEQTWTGSAGDMLADPLQFTGECVIMSPMDTKLNFNELVYELVAQIPAARVMTYGQIAALCGQPRAARIVGGIAHYGDEELPWHRVVNKQGGLAGAFPGGRSAQAQLLEAEGVSVSEKYVVTVDELIWWPETGEGKQ